MTARTATLPCMGCGGDLPAHRRWFCTNACIARWQLRDGNDGRSGPRPVGVPGRRAAGRSECERVSNIGPCPGCGTRPGFQCPRRPVA